MPSDSHLPFGIRVGVTAFVTAAIARLESDALACFDDIC